MPDLPRMMSLEDLPRSFRLPVLASMQYSARVSRQSSVSPGSVRGDTPIQLDVAVSESGRLVIPVALRRRLGIDGRSARVLLRAGQDEVTLTTKARQLRRAQQVVAQLASNSDVHVSDELIRERRAEVRRKSHGR